MNRANVFTALRASRLGNAAIACVLVALLALLVFKTRAVDFDSHGEVIGDLRTLKQIDAEWNADVLRSKMGLNDNYDPVASPLPVLRRLEEGLTERASELMKLSTGERDRFAAALAAYKQAMDEKTALIERFKSQNSILRNSTYFLPVATRELTDALRKAGVAGGAIEALSLKIYSDAMTYSVRPDESLKAAIESSLDLLATAAARWPDEPRETFGVFAAHTRTLLRQHGIGTAVLGQLAAVPTAQRIDELTDTYNRQHEQLLVEQQTYRSLLIAYSVFLLLLLAFAAWRLIRSYREIGRLNEEKLAKTSAQLSEAQLQLVQSSKMSALGQMVAGIAHEINTPLAFVKGTLDVVSEQMHDIKNLAERSYHFTRLLPNHKEVDKQHLHEQYGQVHELSRRIVKNQITEEMVSLLRDGTRGMDQISEIVLNLKNFSRLDRARVTAFDVREGLDSTLLLAKNLLKNKVQIEKHYEDVPKVQCAPSQINQVFLNIISNAAQAIPEQGVLTLRTSMEDQDTVRVEIQDSGSGIPPEVLPKIFDPFFTTKEIGKGTGMGLSISYRIVEEHGGRIVVDTEVGIGTTFAILLPVRQPTAAAFAEDAELAFAA